MLNHEIKINTLSEVIKTPNFLGKYEEHDGILTFLSKIWNLKEMPSEDNRFSNAFDDIFQHVVKNNDWTYEYLFNERLNIINGNEIHFIHFLELIVNPTVRKSKEEILQYISKLNPIIQKSGFRLVLTTYFEELPVFKYKSNIEFEELPIEIATNNIPVFKHTSNKTDWIYPCFYLKYDNWNDFGYITMFDLLYFTQADKFINIGKTKIMRRDTETTFKSLSDIFTTLPNDYCSLGQNKNYYLNLKKVLSENYTSFLLALRDVATFPKIYELFENDNIFKKSIIRANDKERLARTIRYELEGIQPNEYFKFVYTHRPPYATNTIALNFDFEYNSDFEHRIFALIGKNGTGKTKILSSLAIDLAEKEPQSFSPRKPIYGKVFTVSYSFFDRFEIPNSDLSFNYVYCGLKKNNTEWKNGDDLLEDFLKSAKLIKEKNIENEWYEILSNFITTDILDVAFEKTEHFIHEYDYRFIEVDFNEIKNQLSSGQSIILYMVTEILSQVRYDSIILFDEPETHLHPNAISTLINTLFDIVKRFESFCVIATHSPLIIQEIPARNIFVLERENNLAYVRKLERESFGENLTVITQDIFGNREVPRHFISLISQLVSQGKTYEEIIKIVETDDLPVTSNVRLYIKSFTNN